MIKVLLDSSVIIAASIQANIQNIGVSVEQSFYKESLDLFDIFKKYPNKNIGITTKTIRNESFGALPKAVTNFFQKYFPTKGKKELDKTPTINKLCNDEMTSLFLTLSSESPDIDIVRESTTKVTKMSNHLKTEYRSKYSPTKRNAEVKQRTKVNPRWPSNLKSEIRRIQKIQVAREANQLEKFTGSPNSGDRKILAEAIAIKRQIESSGQQVDFYIASSDTGFFSPRRVFGGVKSDIVTKKISSEFGIMCDFPEIIRKQISRSL